MGLGRRGATTKTKSSERDETFRAEDPKPCPTQQKMKTRNRIRSQSVTGCTNPQARKTTSSATGESPQAGALRKWGLKTQRRLSKLLSFARGAILVEGDKPLVAEINSRLARTKTVIGVKVVSAGNALQMVVGIFQNPVLSGSDPEPRAIAEKVSAALGNWKPSGLEFSFASELATTESMPVKFLKFVATTYQLLVSAETPSDSELMEKANAVLEPDLSELAMDLDAEERLALAERQECYARQLRASAAVLRKGDVK
jgi:hypothetical protein